MADLYFDSMIAFIEQKNILKNVITSYHNFLGGTKQTHD